MVKIKVDRVKCIGCGACSATCPDCFEMKDGKAITKKSDCDAPCAGVAISGCPVQAISGS